MKKIAIVLLMALALVSIATAEVVLSGEFEYGFMANADDFAGKFDKVELDINADIDEYNSFSMELEDDIKTNDLVILTGIDPDTGDDIFSDTWLALNWATVTTDWGAMLDLPMGVTTTMGYDGFGYLDSSVTGLGLENFGGFYLPKQGAMKVDITPSDMISLMVASSLGEWGSDIVVLVGTTVDVAPVTVKAAYDLEAEAMAVDAVFGMDVADGMALEVQIPFWYNLADSPAVGSEYKLGAGVAFTAAGAEIGVSFAGNDDEILDSIGADLNYGLTDELSADVGMKYDMVDSELQGIDLSVAYAAGAVSYRLGYVVSDGWGWDYNAEAALADGGFYFNFGLDF